MDFLGIGPLELLFIFLIILIVLGPQDMVKTGQTLGRYLRKIMMSPTWKTVQETSRRIRYLPNTLARQAGIEEFQKELDESMKLDEVRKLDEALKLDQAVEPEKSPYPRGTTPEPGGDPSLGSWTRPSDTNTIQPPELGDPPDEETTPAPADDQDIS